MQYWVELGIGQVWGFLQAFKEANPEFEPAKLVKIVFLFDRGVEGVIFLDEIGFRSGM